MVDQLDLLTDEDLESKMVVVAFTNKDIRGLARKVCDVASSTEDEVQYSNLYEAQILWMDKDWTSNIEWMTDIEYDDKIWDEIRHIVWVEGGLMAELKKLLD